MRLFDPGPLEPTLRVSELTRAIEELIEQRFPETLWIQGEIHDVNRSQAGHVYFRLVEPSADDRTQIASIDVVLFNEQRNLVNKAIVRAGGGMKITNGTKVRIRGTVAFHGQRGRLQVRMTGIDPVFTLGQLAEARERLLAALRTEGVLAANGRLPLPIAPLRVGLVTSADSAAYHDFLRELESSGYGFRVTVVDTRVQGRDAHLGICAAIATAARSGAEIVAVVRGGGSTTDLSAFDHEDVARAIANAAVPVLTGIGHEINTSVADEAAHTALKTPTACAGAIVDQVHRFATEVDEVRARIAERAVRRLDRSAHRLDELRAGVGGLARRAIRDENRRLVWFAGEVVSRSGARFDRAHRRLDELAARVQLLDPARTLARGWSITHDADGHLVRHPDDAPPGTTLRTTVAGGTIESTSTGTTG